MEPPKYYTVDEVAKILGFAAKTIRRYIIDGSLEALQFRTEYRISQDALDEFTKSLSTRRDHKISATEDDPNNNE